MWPIRAPPNQMPRLSVSDGAIRSHGKRGDQLSDRLENRAMPNYMLAAHTSEGDARESMTTADRDATWERISRVEAEMKSAGAWVFSARLHEPSTATVVRVANGEVLTTDGPFAESKDHLAGFYLIEAADLDAALGWGAKVTEAVGHPIEVRPFAGVAWEPGAGG
jgi:hypothetical protein